ncbi:MAG TPA: Gfo/Idh/MocA family oxidoreductase [Ktedonobacterales bacterium]|nr:Gfo/Idh/MocA family oxidoreductase [Ktedonobacterales bacterium]
MNKATRDTPGKDTPRLRYTLIGAGASIASHHLEALAKLPGTEIVGMADANAEIGAQHAAQIGCPFFLDHRELLATVTPDVAVICAPHPLHCSLALDCFAAGTHVLVEKPIAVEVAEAEQMIAAADAAGRLLAVNFQERFRPAVEAAHQMIATGELGEVVRVLCVEPWFRTAAYYRSATWRGTWSGEGGGVLMNQAPHTLDRLCYLAGSPASVWGWIRTLRHGIETEDTAQAMLVYPNGAPGYLEVSTLEAGTLPQMHIIGDKMALEFRGETLHICRFTPSLSAFSATSLEKFATPQSAVETFEPPEGVAPGGEGHLAVHRDLRDAILTGRKPRCAGSDALASLELANAITLSSFTGQSVSLPLDRSLYSALLADLRTGRLEIPAATQAPPGNFTAQGRRQ